MGKSDQSSKNIAVLPNARQNFLCAYMYKDLESKSRRLEMTVPYNYLEGISLPSFLPLPHIRHSKDTKDCQDLVSFKPEWILRGNSASVLPWTLGTPGKV